MGPALSIPRPDAPVAPLALHDRGRQGDGAPGGGVCPCGRAGAAGLPLPAPLGGAPAGGLVDLERPAAMIGRI